MLNCGLVLILHRFLKSTMGTVVVGYGIIATPMVLAIIPAVLHVSTGIQLKFQSLGDYFASFGS